MGDPRTTIPPVEPVPFRRWSLRPDRYAPRRARALVESACIEFDVTGDAAHSVVLAVDELVTNALRDGEIELRLYEDPFAWGVADDDPASLEEVRAHLAEEDRRAPNGHGSGASDHVPDTGGDAPSDTDAAYAGPPAAERGRGLVIVTALFPEVAVVPTTVGGRPSKEVRFTVSGAPYRPCP